MIRLAPTAAERQSDRHAVVERLQDADCVGKLPMHHRAVEIDVSKVRGVSFRRAVEEGDFLTLKLSRLAKWAILGVRNL
jgi:hypothetical protein